MSEGAKGGMGDIIQKAIHYQQQLGGNQPKLHLLSKKKSTQNHGISRPNLNCNSFAARQGVHQRNHSEIVKQAP